MPGQSGEGAAAIAALVKEVPIYQELASPAAREIGLQLARFVRMALAPLRGAMWLEEQAEAAIVRGLAERLASIPEAERVAPHPTVLGPALEALRFAGGEPTLRDLYLNLIGTAMDRRKAGNALPAYVEIIRQLTPDEARILNSFRERHNWEMIDIRAVRQDGKGGFTHIRNLTELGDVSGCTCPELAPVYLENLERLGLVDLPESYRLIDVDAAYERLKQHHLAQQATVEIGKLGRRVEVVERSVQITPLGNHFLAAVDCADSEAPVNSAGRP